MNQQKYVELTAWYEGQVAILTQKYDHLWNAVKEHYDQKADDRCIEDDDRLYAAAGLPPCDRRVGSKAEMLKNCERFIDRRCQEGGWPTYREIETKLATALALLKKYGRCTCGFDQPHRPPGCHNASCELGNFLETK